MAIIFFNWFICLFFQCGKNRRKNAPGNRRCCITSSLTVSAAFKRLLLVIHLSRDSPDPDTLFQRYILCILFKCIRPTKGEIPEWTAGWPNPTTAILSSCTWCRISFNCDLKTTLFWFWATNLSDESHYKVSLDGSKISPFILAWTTQDPGPWPSSFLIGLSVYFFNAEKIDEKTHRGIVDVVLLHP